MADEQKFNHSVAVQELLVMKGFVFACAGRDVNPTPIAPYGGLIQAVDRLLKFHTDALRVKETTEPTVEAEPSEESNEDL